MTSQKNQKKVAKQQNKQLKAIAKTTVTRPDKTTTKITNKNRWHWHWHLPKFVKALIRPARIIGDIVLFPFALVLPYYFGEVYEDYVMHLDVRGLDKYEIVHENYSITFMYTCAAVVTVILCFLLLKRLFYNIKRKD